jgi:triosephosphate isomerase
MRKRLVAGNWKMHGSHSQIHSLVAGIKHGLTTISAIDTVLFPTFVHLHAVRELIAGSSLQLGAQNLHPGTSGAFTGEVSATMLRDSGCQYVLVGHSERRHLFHEDLALVAAKFQAAVQAGLKPILCVGETLIEREKGATQAVIEQQLASVIELVGIAAFQHAVIAYEPVWAIGTGLTATPEQAQEVHAFIRHRVSQQHADLANSICLLYGGSLKGDNAPALFAMPDIDGGLVGGASLEAQSFLAICSAADHKGAAVV